MITSCRAFGFFLSLSYIAAASTNSEGERCNIHVLQQYAPSGSKVLTADHIPQNGTYGQGADDLSYPFNGTSLTEMCAAIVNATSSATSSYTFGLYLPLDWENRFMEVGNGAFAGGINWLDMAVASRYKMATVSTDCGHSSISTNATWALNDPEARADWGWRSIHGALIVGKQLAEGFYQEKIKYTYYMGASTGGRQGLKELGMFPESYDGAIIGAPGWWTNHLQPWMTKVGIDNLPVTATGHIPVEKFTALAAEVVEQCDVVDGVKDGIVSEPEKCHLDYELLLCENERFRMNSTGCLTEDQAKTLKKIYSDYYTSPTGEFQAFAFPGFMLSSEAQWSYLLGGTEPSPLGAAWVSEFLLNDPSWTWQAYNDSIVQLADSLDPGNATADNFDLTKYHEAGGKIVMYHGLSDGGFSARSSQIFYENVAQAMGYHTGGFLSPETAAELQKWFKFYFVPGMQHCLFSVVNAPWYINGPNQAAGLGSDVYSVPGFENPQHDVIMAMMDWVEKGQDFETLVGTAYIDEDPKRGVSRQRPLCPFPMKQIYNGTGDQDHADNWHCSYIA